MVARYPKKLRLLALFVLVFVCLNAGGAVCVAYCRGFETSSHHCPLPKPVTSHCDRSGDKGAEPVVAASNELDFCPMTVSFLAAAVEQKHSFPAEPVLSAVTESDTLRFERPVTRTVSARITYRGPPLLDRRVERIKHRLLLI